MTTPRAAIVFNSSTGSNTAASGLGPSTAITGTAAAHTNGAASTTITLTNSPDLSSLQVGDLLWLNTSSGQQYSVIASWDNAADTVTVDDSFTIASGSAVDYAIGGKRSTFDHVNSRTLFVDWKSFWKVETETDQNVTTSAITFTGSGTVQDTYILATGTRRTISQSANASIFTQSGSSARLKVENLKFQNSNVTKTAAGAVQIGGLVVAENCIFGDATNKLLTSVRTNGNGTTVWFHDCYIIDTTDSGINIENTSNNFIEDCFIKGCSDSGIDILTGNPGNLQIRNTIITGCTTYGIVQSSANTTGIFLQIINCTIRANGIDGIRLTQSTHYPRVDIRDCNITENGGFGINAPSSPTFGYLDIRNNNFGISGTANTSGDTENVTEGDNNINVNPQYTNTGGNDFSVGTNVKAKGFPIGGSRFIGAAQSATYTYKDIGAAQREESVISTITKWFGIKR